MRLRRGGLQVVTFHDSDKTSDIAALTIGGQPLAWRPCTLAPIQCQLDRPKVDWIVCKPFSFLRGPRIGPALLCPLQWHHMVNINILAVLDNVACKGADPTTGNDPATVIARETHWRAGTCDQRLSAAVLAVAIGIVPAVPKGRSSVRIGGTFVQSTRIIGCQLPG